MPEQAPSGDAMNLRWEDVSEPIAQHSFTTMASELGLALALEVLARSRDAQLCAALPRVLRSQIQTFLSGHRVEAGGLLLGRRFALSTTQADAGGPGRSSIGECSMISIEQFVPGKIFEGTGISLALGTEVWDDARPLIDAGCAVVGWVHSHPDLGAFFSGTDRSTQRAFFAQPWQVGICIDPVRDESAWFRGKDSLDEGIVCIEF
jgi:hypothetical protein